MLERVARRGKRADGKERGRRIPVPQLRDNDRATPPAALLPRAGNGCVDFGAGRRCPKTSPSQPRSLGRNLHPHHNEETIEILEWVARRGRMADGKERGRRIPVPQLRDNDRATPPAPNAFGASCLLPRAGDGCVDFGAGLRCSLGRGPSRTGVGCGYRRCASRDLANAEIPSNATSFQYFNSLRDQN